MDLPTYTNIWRIEKRLYKLYDLRLPMPLPLVQIGVFIGVFVPWILLLRLIGVPFHTPWHVLYLVPPGVLTWMATRPVIEGKRLTELLLSQTRYLTEPRTWCRLTPIREPREVVIVARVWRQTDRRPAPATIAAAQAGEAARGPIGIDRPAQAARPRPLEEHAAQAAGAGSDGAWGATAAAPGFGADFHGMPVAQDRTAPAAERAVPGPDVVSAERAAQLEPPPATPRLEMPPASPRTDGRAPAEPEQRGDPGGERASAPPVGSGKRGLASGVRRPGRAAEFWKAIAPPPAQDDIAAPGEEGGQAEQPAPPQQVVPTRPDVPQVPGAFGASGSAKGARDAAPEPAAADSAAAEPATDGAATGEAAVGESAADRPAVEEPAAEEPTDRSRERQSQGKAPVKEPPKPWSEELSRPSREARADALVWPPANNKPGGAPAKPSPAPRPSSAEPERQPTAGRRPLEAPRKVPGFAVPPPGDPDGTPPAPADRPVTPHEGRQSPWSMPTRSPATSSTPLPPPVVPDVRPEPQRPPPPAPAREMRSGPASPVRARPLPLPPPPPPSAPAITPPDPDQEGTAGGLRRLIQAVGGGHGQVESDYEERLQQPFHGTRRIVVLGCTGGAGQTVTALMLGHTFAQFCAEAIAAIDINPGPGALARRTRSEAHETLTGLITHADQVNSLTAMRRYASRAKSGLDVIAAGRNPLQALDDRDYALAIQAIDRFYSVTMLDAAAAVVARILPHADQVVLVAPASADAPRAVTMTFEWLDGHGYGELRSSAVTVINGVSRRSMDDVEQAEAVARGRCRALVRIPWDDHLSLDRSPRNELKSLRTPTRRAYLALAGVVAGGFATLPERYVEEAGDQQQEASR